MDIPNGALSAAADALLEAQKCRVEIGQASARVVHAAAPLIVAAELELIANRWQGQGPHDSADETEDAYFEGINDLAAAMRRRASELRGDGPATASVGPQPRPVRDQHDGSEW